LRNWCITLNIKQSNSVEIHRNKKIQKGQIYMQKKESSKKVQFNEKKVCPWGVGVSGVER